MRFTKRGESSQYSLSGLAPAPRLERNQAMRHFERRISFSQRQRQQFRRSVWYHRLKALNHQKRVSSHQSPSDGKSNLQLSDKLGASVRKGAGRRCWAMRLIDSKFCIKNAEPTWSGTILSFAAFLSSKRKIPGDVPPGSSP